MDPTKCNLIDLGYVASLAVAAQNVRVQQGYRPFVIVPNPDGGMRVELLQPESTTPLPDHIRQRLTLVELESFTLYVKQFKNASSRIFGCTDASGAHFTAAMDYHEAGKEGNAGRLVHIAEYAPRYSDEFAAWLSINAKPLTQDQFLDHVRRWGYVVTSHTDADLIELVSSLEFSTQGQFASKIERTRGGRKLVWNEDVQGSGSIQGKTVVVPDGLTLKLPIFLGGKEYEIGSDLLYRVNGGRLSIASELRQQQRVIRDAVNDLVADVEAGTELDVFVGSVEVRN